MPKLHTKCGECGAMLTPRGPDVPEGWVHTPSCSKYRPHFVTQLGQPARRLCCGTAEGEEHKPECKFMWGEHAPMSYDPPYAQQCNSFDCRQTAFGIEHAMDCRNFVAAQNAMGAQVVGAVYNPLEEWTKQQVQKIAGKSKQGSDHILDDKWVSCSGASSSEKAPPFHLIPIEVLISEAERYGLGEMKHGRGNFEKACGSYIEPAEHPGQDKAWMIDRINHGILHALRWLAKLEGLIPWNDDDDAGAVQWLGGIMHVYEAEWKRRRGEAASGASTSR